MFTRIGRDIVFSVDLWYNELGDENGYRKRIAKTKSHKIKRL